MVAAAFMRKACIIGLVYRKRYAVIEKNIGSSVSSTIFFFIAKRRSRNEDSTRERAAAAADKSLTSH